MQFMRARRGPVTAAIVAKQFGVSERTSYRDIGARVAQGALIDGAADLGYITNPGRFLPPLMFSPDEVDAIMLGFRYAMRRGDRVLGDDALDSGRLKNKRYLAVLLDVKAGKKSIKCRC